jgi:hypothetical protein
MVQCRLKDKELTKKFKIQVFDPVTLSCVMDPSKEKPAIDTVDPPDIPMGTFLGGPFTPTPRPPLEPAATPAPPPEYKNQDYIL